MAMDTEIPKCPKCGYGGVHQTDMRERGAQCILFWKCDYVSCGHEWRTSCSTEDFMATYGHPDGG